MKLALKLPPLLVRIARPAALALAGIASGAGGAFAAVQTLGVASHQEPPAEAPETVFVKVEDVLTPLTNRDGSLAGYAAMTLELEVVADDAEDIAARQPLIRHALTMRTYRTPLAAGPDGLLPDLERFRALAVAAAEEAYGKGTVRRVAITRAVPA